MEHNLVLELPEEVYKPLIQQARQLGSTPEALVTKWLTIFIRTPNDDPVENFIGALESHGANWADQHDDYIGQSLREQL